ncbi:glycosyltransferase family 4 protein [Patescibacteria group bacterium]|nr:glycosyltransferase family 4 protein [Patescibacteria group bacterium]
MKIVGVDLRCLPQDGSDGAGVAHAARELCLHMQRIAHDKVLDVEIKFYVPKGGKWSEGKIIWLDDATGKSLRGGLKENPCDILFVPSGSIPPAIKIPVVPWVHDLIIFDHPEWFNQTWLQSKITTHLFAKGLRKAPVIFAVSEYTKKSITRILNIPAEKIIVTGEGGDGLINSQQLTKNKEIAKDFCEKELELGKKFFLCLGTVEPRKNVVMLIRAWKKAKQEFAQVPDLVIAGANGWKFDNVEEEIKKLKGSEEKFFYRFRSVTDEQKRTLLLGADMVAVPSLDEGFGLVALEAMQAGTPVAVSDVGALPEVVGEAEMIIDPLDQDGWMGAIMTCAKDERACDLMAKKGLVQAEKWNWERSSEIVYQNILKLI